MVDTLHKPTDVIEMMFSGTRFINGLWDHNWHFFMLEHTYFCKKNLNYELINPFSWGCKFADAVSIAFDLLRRNTHITHTPPDVIITEWAWELKSQLILSLANAKSETNCIKQLHQKCVMHVFPQSLSWFQIVLVWLSYFCPLLAYIIYAFIHIWLSCAFCKRIRVGKM